MKRITTLVLVLLLAFAGIHVKAQELEEFRFYGEDLAPLNNAVQNEFQFNGFTNYWQKKAMSAFPETISWNWPTASI